MPSNNYVLVSENKSYRSVFELIAKALNRKRHLSFKQTFVSTIVEVVLDIFSFVGSKIFSKNKPNLFLTNPYTMEVKF